MKEPTKESLKELLDKKEERIHELEVENALLRGKLSTYEAMYGNK